MNVLFKRPDGTFVIEYNGMPYHVTAEDPMFAQASELGQDAPFEPVLEVEPQVPTLSPSQWRFFLNITGFGTVLDMTLDAMPKTTLQERAAWAALEAIAYGSPEYTLPTTIALAAQFAGENGPSQADIEDAWAMAAQFQGAASIMGLGNG